MSERRTGASVWKLFARAVSDLSLAVIISTLVGLPLVLLITFSSPFQHEDRFQFSGLPPDDEAVTEWARAQPGVERPAVRRDGDIVAVRYLRSGGEPLRPPWVTLGYQDARSLTFSISVCFVGAECGEGTGASRQLAIALLVLGLASGAGLLTVGVWRVRRCRRAGEPLLTFFAGAPRTAIVAGAAAGGALLLLSLLSDLALRAVVGPPTRARACGAWSASSRRGRRAPPWHLGPW